MALGQSAALSSARSGLAMSGGGVVADDNGGAARGGTVAGTAGPAGEEAEGEVHVPAGQHDYSHIDRSQVDSVGKLGGFYNEMTSTSSVAWRFDEREVQQVKTMDREMLRQRNPFTDFYERQAVLMAIGMAGRK